MPLSRAELPAAEWGEHFAGDNSSDADRGEPLQRSMTVEQGGLQLYYELQVDLEKTANMPDEGPRWGRRQTISAQFEVKVAFSQGKRERSIRQQEAQSEAV